MKSRLILSLGLAASLVLIAVTGLVAVMRADPKNLIFELKQSSTLSLEIAGK